jgi:hypothetical protein
LTLSAAFADPPAPQSGSCFRDRREVGHLVKRTNRAVEARAAQTFCSFGLGYLADFTTWAKEHAPCHTKL